METINNTTELSVILEEVDALVELLCDMSCALNPGVLKHYPKLISLLKIPELYTPVCALLAEACQNLKELQDLLFHLGIFKYIKFGEKGTYYLIFSLCTNNKTNTDYFVKNLYNKERDKDERIERLFTS
ncbi:hypothetical protein TCON_0473 [Astathelohania contejeani]|uniref:Uncharacterized protein n=1 Tax=Astathelohania contejeani TaxID=164912 RepID=A0ABQ7I1I7_9MICR|nr:hypothetical protein TCON_0473 [Thelohania contejeani]